MLASNSDRPTCLNLLSAGTDWFIFYIYFNMCFCLCSVSFLLVLYFVLSCSYSSYYFLKYIILECWQDLCLCSFELLLDSTINMSFIYPLACEGLHYLNYFCFCYTFYFFFNFFISFFYHNSHNADESNRYNLD